MALDITGVTITVAGTDYAIAGDETTVRTPRGTSGLEVTVKSATATGGSGGISGEVTGTPKTVDGGKITITVSDGSTSKVWKVTVVESYLTVTPVMQMGVGDRIVVSAKNYAYSTGGIAIPTARDNVVAVFNGTQSSVIMLGNKLKMYSSGTTEVDPDTLVTFRAVLDQPL